MEDDNESLQTMGLNIGLSNDDSYINIKVKEGKTAGEI